MSCPYIGQNLQQLPCHIVQHPENENIFFCCVCKNACDAREVEKSSGNGLVVMLALIVAITLITTGRFEESSQPAIRPNSIESQSSK